jgi:uncharacterized protein
MHTLYLDADSCPVKDESIKVAVRHGWRVIAVANSYMTLPRRANVSMVVVTDGFDAADDYIAERVVDGDVVVTADIPLASRSVHAGGKVITPRGRLLDAESVGEALSSRNLMESLREAGTITGGPPPMTKRDRSVYLQKLDTLLHSLR